MATKILSDYGIDPNKLFDRLQNGAPQVDPNVSALQQQVQQLYGALQQQQQSVQQQEQQTLNSEIAKFSTDPEHKHFESVRTHMAALLQAGQAENLKDAYEQAVWANPTTRALVLAEQQNKDREEATRKAKEAKEAASINTRSRPSMPTTQPIGSMDDTIRQTFRRLTAS
jgi:predicted Abi (CAAX) family protease